MAYRSPSRKSAKAPLRVRLLAVLIPLLLVAGGIYWSGLRGDEEPTPQDQQSAVQNNENTDQQPAYTAPDLQPTIDQWVTKYTADYHIAVYDFQADKMIGQYEPDASLFAASLYKLFVAYLSLKDFQAGSQDPNEVISQGRTRLQCVEAMIRSSDSPCGESMMADMGQSVLNQRVVDEIGTTGTYFNGIRTSASDSIKVLGLIHAKKFLTDEYAALLSDAMLVQDAKFKRGLQTGAPDAKWETKVGWNEDINYHDVGIMTLPDGRKFAVAILGQGSGSSAPIADFARTIYAALTQ